MLLWIIISIAAGIDSGYDAARIIEVLINTLVQKNAISEQEANYIEQTGKGVLLTDKVKLGPSRRGRYKL
jgi:hypothetical protein